MPESRRPDEDDLVANIAQAAGPPCGYASDVLNGSVNSCCPQIEDSDLVCILQRYELVMQGQRIVRLQDAWSFASDK